jgi:hypothetical protein
VIRVFVDIAHRVNSARERVCIETVRGDVEVQCRELVTPSRELHDMARKRKVATKRVTRKPARKHSASPDATINTLVILVVIVMVLGGLFLYAQNNKKQAALWQSIIMQAIANLPAPPLAAVVGEPEATGSVQPPQPAGHTETPRPSSAIETPYPAAAEAPRPASAIEAPQPMLAAAVPQPAPNIEMRQSISDSQSSNSDATPGIPQTTGSIQAPKPQAALGASRATGSVHSAKRRTAIRKVRKPAPKIEPPQPVSGTVAARSPNID